MLVPIEQRWNDGAREENRPSYPHDDSYLCIRKMVRARDYLNGYGPFGRYNFFNISAPIGTGRRPLKDHPSTKVGRLPRRHRKTPSSGSGAAPVISRKPHHFACIIHSNSPGSPPASQPNVESATATEKKQHETRSFRFLVLSCTRNGLFYCQRRHRNVPGPRLHSSEALLTIYLKIIRTHSMLMLVLIYIMLTFVGRSLCAHVCILPSKCKRPPFYWSLAFKPVLKNTMDVYVYRFLIP